MVTDRFGALIEELSTAMKTQLTPDSHNACKIRFPDKLNVYMEPNASEDEVQVIVEIGKPGEGKFRENIFRESLRANGLPPPRLGIFCYSQKEDSLLLFEPHWRLGDMRFSASSPSSVTEKATHAPNGHCSWGRSPLPRTPSPPARTRSSA